MSPPGRRRSGGFTLLELVLSLSLLALLTGVAIGAFWGTLSATKIRASATRMSSLLRSMRAEAANTGRRLQLTFDEETRQPMVSIEADPLGEPGVFAPHNPWWAEKLELMEGVHVALCRLTGDSVFSGQPDRPGDLADADQAELAPLTFAPDGSSDSARIVLAREGAEHTWAVEITLNGVDGSVSTRQIDTEEEPIE